MNHAHTRLRARTVDDIVTAASYRDLATLETEIAALRQRLTDLITPADAQAGELP